METFDKVSMSLDEIIRKSRSRSTYSSQPQRLRSRSQTSYRSGSQIPSLCSVPCTPPRRRSLPHQTNSFRREIPASAQHFRLQYGFRANKRKHRPDFSACSNSVLRLATSFQQLRFAKKRVEVAKKMLNARHQSYLKQLRQYRHEISENSFIMAQYILKNTQDFPDLFSAVRNSNKISHHHRGRQQVQPNNTSQGTLSVTFVNELANSQSDIHTAEDVATTMNFRPPEAFITPPQMLVNDCTIRNPYVGKVTNNTSVYVSPQEIVRKTVTTDSLPTLVSSLDFPQLM